MCLALSWSLYFSLSLSLALYLYVSSSLWSNVSKVKRLLDCSLKALSKCICLCHCLCLCLCLCHCIFFVQVMSPHHSDQMYIRSQVSRMALWRCSLNVFVFVIIFVFVFVFGIVFFWSVRVSSSLWSNVSKVTSLWDRSLKVLSKCICLCHCLCLCLCICHCLFVGQVNSPHHSDQVSQRSQVSRVTLLLCF